MSDLGGGDGWIYLDHCATTELRPEAEEALRAHRYLANPSSTHGPGRKARHALTRARREIAEALGVERDQVVFTGNGSEANVLAIEGTVARLPADRRRVLTSPVEHPCVRNALERCARRAQIVVQELAVDGEGLVHPETLAAALGPDVGLVVVMTANHEIGTVQPVAELREIAHRARARFHTDACQAVGRIDVSAARIAADSLTFSAHKFGGPRGVGVVVRARDFELDSPLSDARQEFGLRGGTEDVAACVATSVALRAALNERERASQHLVSIRERLLRRLRHDHADLVVHSPPVERCIPALVNLSLPELLGPWLVAALDRRKVAVSHGSACSSRAALPSPVLRAIGREDLSRCALRISMSPHTSADQVDEFCARLRSAVDELRRTSRI